MQEVEVTMCGIFGGIGVKNDEVRSCLEVILRGNDGITVKDYDEVVMGSRRHLVKESDKPGVGDGESDQPYESGSGDAVLVFNGELYNFDALREDLVSKGHRFDTEGDTEVFLKLYEEYGVKMLEDKRVDSLFSLAVLDRKNHKLHITRDWPGRIPLFYYYDKEDKKFVFSSELKGFRPIDWIHLSKPVELKPGYILTLDLDTFELTEERYYKPVPLKTNLPLLDVGEELYNLLNESGKNRTMGDVPICTMLSGGIDSLLSTFFVLSNIDFNKVGYQPKSYVYAIDNYVSEDVRRATLAAEGFREIGLELRVIRTPGDQLVEDLPHIIELFEMRAIKALSVYPLPIYYYLAPEMKKDGFKVTVGGHGVDELLGAYDAWKELTASHKVQIDHRSRLRFMDAIYENMMRRASIIFMNQGPIEARFPYLSPKVCEYMLGIDPKWLNISIENTEILLSLIEKKGGSSDQWTDHLKNIYKYLSQYLDNNGKHPEDADPEEVIEMEKLFWKLPLMVAGMFASDRSFLPFNLLFNAKLRGQHGAGITSLEEKVVEKYYDLGSSDSEIFLNMVDNIFYKAS